MHDYISEVLREIENYRAEKELWGEMVAGYYRDLYDELKKHPGRRYVLNSAVITAPGTYEYKRVSPEEAKRWWFSGDPPLSTVGYPETAEALSQLLGVPVQVNRVTIVMEPGDEALVFRLVLPPGTPRIQPHEKGRIAEHVRAGHWELGLLRRLR